MVVVYLELTDQFERDKSFVFLPAVSLECGIFPKGEAFAADLTMVPKMTSEVLDQKD